MSHAVNAIIAVSAAAVGAFLNAFFNQPKTEIPFLSSNTQSCSSFENKFYEIKHPAASSGVLTALLNLLVLNQLSPQGAGN
jgi:hypothetical protein